MRRSVLCLVGGLLLAGVARAQEAEDPFAGMTPEQRAAMGLDKLSEAELAALRAYLAGQGEVPKAADEPGAEALAAAPEAEAERQAELEAEIEARVQKRIEEDRKLQERIRLEKAKEDFGDIEKPQQLDQIESRIVGDFRGWRGKTYFELENGQIWVQRQSGTYVKRMTNPEVILTKELLGYVLTIKQTGARVGVRRVR